MSRTTKYILQAAVAVALTGSTAQCVQADEAEPDTYDRIWDYGKLYSSDEGIFRTFDLSGRLQAEAIWFDDYEDRVLFDEAGLFDYARVENKTIKAEIVLEEAEVA